MNIELLQALSELQEITQILGQGYRATAYERAINALRKLQYQIGPGHFNELKGLPGIGRGILNKIKEFVTSGKIAELDELRDAPHVKAYRVFNGILGVGPKTAENWIKMGIMDIAALREAVGERKITLTNAQKWGLRYYEDLARRIPRAEVDALAEYIKSLTLQIDPNVIFNVSGSYRRGAPSSGDIDILVSNSSHFDETLLENLAKLLKVDPNFVDIISLGHERLTFLYRSEQSGTVRQIDVLHIRYGSYFAALLYFTGSGEFNQAMRGYAKAKNYRLNQAGLYKLGPGAKQTLVPTNSEQEIFDILGLEYVPPHERDDPQMIPKLSD